MSYYNTTHLEGSELVEAWKQATNQEAKVLVLFRAHPAKYFSAPEVANKVFPNQSVPLTSVRRAITDLTNAGCLVRTDSKVPGLYGKDNYQWRLR